ncbi:uncharacterized protein LOC127265715 [Andrographis paniculata]|uniref:uncharacterized protein LOC127265715 n=1 Tax=Andrographis paniculata TaxID=175694 RepID=UPI0021E9350C|nr:uncharacterized protein LOC127265715 [Andrographis paniculata]
MVEKSSCTVYIGNVDERVMDRVLYDILIQAGPVVDLYVPRDKETDKPRGYAFAEYESEEIAEYAVKLFSGLVTLYKRTLKFAISGQDKAPTATPTSGSPPIRINFPQVSPNASSSRQHRSQHDSSDYNYSRRAFGGALDGINRTRSGR